MTAPNFRMEDGDGSPSSAPRYVRRISDEQLARIMGETNAPHPGAGEYGSGFAYRIFMWGVWLVIIATFVALVVVK